MKKVLANTALAVVIAFIFLATVLGCQDDGTRGYDSSLYVRNKVVNYGTLDQQGVAEFDDSVTVQAQFAVTGTLIFPPETLTVATAQSGDTLTIPATGSHFVFDDTLTACTYILSSGTIQQGRMIHLLVPAAGAVDTLSDAGNLALTAAFNGTANDYIVLMYTDTLWRELGRNAN